MKATAAKIKILAIWWIRKYIKYKIIGNVLSIKWYIIVLMAAILFFPNFKAQNGKYSLIRFEFSRSELYKTVVYYNLLKCINNA